MTLSYHSKYISNFSIEISISSRVWPLLLNKRVRSVSKFVLIKIIGKYNQDVHWKRTQTCYGTLDTVLNITSKLKVSNIEHQTCLKTAKEFPRLESLDISRSRYVIFY